MNKLFYSQTLENNSIAFYAKDKLNSKIVGKHFGNKANLTDLFLFWRVNACSLCSEIYEFPHYYICLKLC
jgi:hypothetical protein